MKITRTKKSIKASYVPAARIKTKDDFYYDAESSLEDNEIEMFEDLGWMQEDDGERAAIIPKGTILKYKATKGRWILYQVEGTDYVLPFNNTDSIFELKFDDDFKVVESSIRASRSTRPGDIIIIKKDYPVGWIDGEDLYLPSGTRLEYLGAESDSGLVSLQDIDSEEPQSVNLTEEQYYKAFRQGYFKKVKANVSSAEEADKDENDLDQVDQEFTSKDTSINSGKLPAIYKLVNFPKGSLVIDYGGGKFDNGIEYLNSIGVTGLVYDPYNRTAQYNKETIKKIRENGGADIALCSNVLNVIKEEEARLNVLKNIRKLLKSSGTAYITVYEGKGTGEAKQSQDDAYQLHRKTADYLDEIHKVFPDAKRKGKLIIATPTGEVTASKRIQSSSDFKYDYRTSHPNYCPHCCNKTLTEVEDGYYVCDECGEEYRGEPSFEGGLYLKKVEDEEIEGGCNVNSATNTLNLGCKVSGSTINYPAYAVKYVSGYAGNGVNRYEYKYFRTPEEQEAFVKDLESRNVIGIETYTIDNFYHTYPEDGEPVEASYGGAYDIGEDDYFTKEELVEFGDAVADEYNKRNYDGNVTYELSSIYLDPSEDNKSSKQILEITLGNVDSEIVSKVQIDMRRIKRPSDIYKYMDRIYEDLKKEDWLLEDVIESSTNVSTSEIEYERRNSEGDVRYKVPVDSSEYIESLKSKKAKWKKDKLVKEIQDELYNAASKVLKGPEFGFPISEIADILFVDVSSDDYVIIAEVRAEVSWEGMWKLKEELDKIVSKYDEEAYFDMVEPGIMEAYIRETFAHDVKSATNIMSAKEDFIPEDDFYEAEMIEKTYEVEFDVKLVVDDDGSFIVTEDNVSPIYDDVLELDIDDTNGIVENIQDLIANNVPEGPGDYRASGIAKLTYDIDGVAITKDGFGEEYYYATNAEVSFDEKGSWVENFQIYKE